MPNSVAPVAWTPAHVWGLIDHQLLNAKLAEIAEEMHPRLARDKARARSEGRRKGNAAFYPAERIRLEEARADEWAEKIYQATLKVWETQGYKPCRALYLVTHEKLLAPMFEARKGAVSEDMRLEALRTGQPGQSATMLGAFSRAMGRLGGRWRRRMEVAARENEYAIQREQSARQGTPSHGAGPAQSNEAVLTKGTQYEAFKKVTAILRSSRQEILIADNYLNDEVLDMLLAVPTQPRIRLLTFRPAADFKVALKRFQGQDQRAVEARVHSAEIHDRAIVVDGAHFYTLGGSIKDMGAKLTFLNKLEDASNISKLRTELERIWASAVLIS